MDLLTVVDSVFYEGEGEFGSGLYCYNCEEVSIDDSSFIGLIGDKGGAVSLSISAN